MGLVGLGYRGGVIWDDGFNAMHGNGAGLRLSEG